MIWNRSGQVRRLTDARLMGTMLMILNTLWDLCALYSLTGIATVKLVREPFPPFNL